MLCDDLIRRFAPDIGLDVSDLPVRSPRQSSTHVETSDVASSSYPEPPTVPWETHRQHHLQPLACSLPVPALYGRVIHPSIFTDYNEYLLHNATTGEITDPFFPTSFGMSFDSDLSKDQIWILFDLSSLKKENFTAIRSSATAFRRDRQVSKPAQVIFASQSVN